MRLLNLTLTLVLASLLILESSAVRFDGSKTRNFNSVDSLFLGPSVFVEFPSKRIIPTGWKVIKTLPDPSAPIKLTFAIKQQNVDQLEKTFWEISTPGSQRYGKFLSDVELFDLIRPDPTSVSTLQKWLDSQKVSRSSQMLTRGSEFLQIQVPLRHAEQLLGCTFLTFEHIDSGIQIIRSLQPYKLPLLISTFVDFVGGVSRFPQIRKIKSFPSDEAAVTDVTPALIKQWYNISTYEGRSKLNNQSVAQFLKQYYDPKDLQQFQNTFSLPQIQPTVLGPNIAKFPGTEASLDIQYIMGVATNVTTFFVSTPGLHEGQEPFLQWITDLLNATSRPLINSVSYGDEEASLSQNYTERINQEFMKFGSLGYTILFASGDSGAGCSLCKSLIPNFPATSPYVTSVGGTELNSQGMEVGVSFSSGGFSNYFAMPKYQQDAVQSYLSSCATSLPAASLYNSSGRAFPDISAFSTNFQVIVSGIKRSVAGTSCATPTAAGIFSLLNDIRITNNLPPLGFLNPLIYQLASSTPGSFNDITTGDNSQENCCGGYSACKGWDAITGVGSPNFAILRNAVLNASLFS